MVKISQFADKIGMGDKNSKAARRQRREQRQLDLIAAFQELEDEKNQQIKMNGEEEQKKMNEEEEEMKMNEDKAELKLNDEEEMKMNEGNENE
jgi:hypothetical protein